MIAFTTGWTPPTGRDDLYMGSESWATIGDMASRVLADTAKCISSEAIELSGVRPSPPGSLLFSFKLSIGQVAFAGKELYTNEAIATFRHSPAVDLGFAYYAFPLFVTKNAADNIYGAKLLNQDLIKNAILAIPPVGEQFAVAAFLDRETGKIDALIAEQERLIALLKEKRQAVISQAVTKGLDPNVPMKESGVEWLGEVPAHWEVRSISSLTTKITNGYVGPTRDILVDEGTRYLQSLHIKNNKIDFHTPYFVEAAWSACHSKSILEAGDVLVVQTGDVGQTAVVTEEFAGCNCHALIILAPLRNSITGPWLSWVLNSEFGKHSLLSIQTGALHPHLNCGDVKDVRIPLPLVDEQRKIVMQLEERLAAFDLLQNEAGNAVILLRERRAALISAAVTGKIDVRDYVTTEQADAA
ncbi:restriction endonuclease subunit S [Roseomonas sp. ACRSG]|nr:restriction endonuclease subunit S [Roseomonas sp. ACRSG]